MRTKGDIVVRVVASEAAWIDRDRAGRRIINARVTCESNAQ